MAGPIAAVLAAIVGFLLLVRQHRRDERAARSRRAEMLADCMGVVDCPSVAFDPLGYPVLSGRYQGLPVRVDVIVDMLALRKLPALWVRATVMAPVAIDATFDAMMRPSGSELFSGFHDLPRRVDTPPDWPERAVIRTDDPEGLPAADVLAPHVAILDHPRAKELLATPRGVRLVWLADEAERGDYLLLRQARFGLERFDADCLADLLRRCVEVREALAQAASPREPAREAAE